MAFSFMWTTIHILLWNYVIHTSGGIASYGHEDKSIDLRRRSWYASHNDKRQVRDTRPVSNGKFNEPSPITGLDHMGNPFLRLPPSGSSVTAKKPHAPSGNRDKSKPKNNDSTTSNHLGKVPEKNVLRTLQDSSYLSLPTTFPDTSDNAANINHALNYFGNAHISSDGSTGITDDNFFSSLSNEYSISPQSEFKSNNPLIFSNEHLSNAIVNNEPCDDNAPQTIESLEQKLWNEEIKPSFFNQESMFENKLPLFSPPNRFTAPLDTSYGERTQPSWLNQMTETPGIKSQSIPPALPLQHGQQQPTIDLAESPKIIETAAITSTSESTLTDKTELTARLDEQEHQTTTLSESSQLTESSFISSTFGPMPMERVELTTLPDEQQQQQMTNLPESPELAENSVTTSMNKPTGIEEDESTSLPNEQQQTTVSDVPESPKSTETPTAGSVTSEQAPTEREESTNPPREKPSRPSPAVPAKPVKTPAATNKPKPTPLEKKPSIFMPYEQSPLIDWPSPPGFINDLGSTPSQFPAHDDALVASPWAFPYKTEQRPFSTNGPQFTASSEDSKYFNDAYQQFLLRDFYTSQPIRSLLPFPLRNQLSFGALKFSKPSDTLSEYYLHMLSENIAHCLDG